MKYLFLWVVFVILICVGCLVDVFVLEIIIFVSLGLKIKVIEDWFVGKYIVVVGSKVCNVVVVFECEFNGVLLDFQGVDCGFFVIMIDVFGISWDVWG